MRTTVAALLLIAAPIAARAQAVVDPGMSKAQVVAALGKPRVEKTTGNATFLYYPNGLEKTVGTSDLVILEGDKVVDAVFRSAARKYTGKSSSPAAIPRDVAQKRPDIAPPPAGLSVPARPPARPAAPAAAPAPAPTAGACDAQKLPAECARESEVVRPIPTARSAILEKAAADKAAAEKAKSDTSKGGSKTDTTAKATKRP